MATALLKLLFPAAPERKEKSGADKNIGDVNQIVFNVFKLALFLVLFQEFPVIVPDRFLDIPLILTTQFRRNVTSDSASN
jgi:hypothetical protein